MTPRQRRTTVNRGMVPDEGIEPPTFGLQNRCSTAELIRRFGGFCAISDPSRAQGRASGRAGRDSRRPRAMRGQRLVHAGPRGHGDRDEREGRAALGAKLKCSSERDGQRGPWREWIDPLCALLTAPDAAASADHKPDFLDRSMHDRVRHPARRAIRNAPCFRRRGSEVGAPPFRRARWRRSPSRASWFRKAWPRSPTSDKRLTVPRARKPRCLGAAIGGLLRGGHDEPRSNRPKSNRGSGA